MIAYPSLLIRIWIEKHRHLLFKTLDGLQSFLDGHTLLRDGPLEKWWGWGRGGGGEKNKKNSCKGKCQEKNSCKEEGKKKNSCRRKVQLWLFQKVRVCFRASEFQKSTIWINKNLFLLIERRQLEPCFGFKLQLVYLQHTLYTVL